VYTSSTSSAPPWAGRTITGVVGLEVGELVGAAVGEAVCVRQCGFAINEISFFEKKLEKKAGRHGE
jgi:hypothetical protein